MRVLGSKDTTRKFLFRLADGNLIESVLIPASPALYGETSDRRTACVSSQVGCAYGCKFCASGLDGFTRNLDASEIVDQLLAVERLSGEKIDNIVFMGMGEPLANLDEPAARHPHHQRALGPRPRRAPHHHLHQRPRPADSQTRRRNRPSSASPSRSTARPTKSAQQIMPVNRKYPRRRACSTASTTTSRKKKRLMLEYILIAGVNDS